MKNYFIVIIAVLVLLPFGSGKSVHKAHIVDSNHELQAPLCFSRPQGLLNFWPGDGSGLDIAGSKDVTLRQTRFVPGLFGSAFYFDGQYSYLGVGLEEVSIPWTLSMWARRLNASQSGASLLEGTVSKISLEMDNTTRRIGFNGRTSFEFDYSLPEGSWTHVTLVALNGRTNLYINGSFHSYVLGAVNLPRGTFGGTARPLHAMVSEVMILSRPLMFDEVEQLYSSKKGVCRGSRPVPPSSYDMRNGEIGPWGSYLDTPYSGPSIAGDPSSSLSQLSGGAGILTNGNRDFVGAFSNPNSYVGWLSMDPVITFRWPHVQQINTITIYFDDNDGVGGVAAPAKVSLRWQDSNGNQTLERPVNDPWSGRPFGFVISQLSIQTSAITMQISRKAGWVFISEVEFSSSPHSRPSAPDLIGWGTYAGSCNTAFLYWNPPQATSGLPVLEYILSWDSDPDFPHHRQARTHSSKSEFVLATTKADNVNGQQWVRVAAITSAGQGTWSDPKLVHFSKCSVRIH